VSSFGPMWTLHHIVEQGGISLALQEFDPDACSFPGQLAERVSSLSAMSESANLETRFAGASARSPGPVVGEAHHQRGHGQ
jgi:hypothetical protein